MGCRCERPGLIGDQKTKRAIHCKGVVCEALLRVVCVIFPRCRPAASSIVSIASVP